MGSHEHKDTVLGGNLGKYLTPRGLTIASKAWYASHELVRPSSPTTGADGISTATAGAFFDAVDQVGLGTVSTAALREGLAARREGREVAGEEEGRSCSSKAECGSFPGRASRRDGDNEEACGEDNGGVKHGACGEESASCAKPTWSEGRCRRDVGEM